MSREPANAVPAARRIPVLMYHRIGEAGTDFECRYTVSPMRFAEHMGLLAARGYRTCTADEFCAWAAGERALPDPSFLLTFDDGFLGVHEYAMPVLESLGWSATVFLVSGLIGGRDLWRQDDSPSGTTHPLLGRRHIEEMTRRGFVFQSHTRSHADLTTIAPERLSDELLGARLELEDLLGTRVAYLAYPYGRYDERVLEATRTAGYSAAFSVQPGFNRQGVDPYKIRRLDVFGGDSAMNLFRKVRLGSNDGTVRAAAAYYARQLGARLGLGSFGNG